MAINEFNELNKIDEIQIIINGRLLGVQELQEVSDTNLQATYTKLVPSSNEKKYEFSIPLQLEPGLNRIEIVAANDASHGLSFKDISAPQSETAQRGDLWLLAIGVNEYSPNPGYLNLQFAVSDSQKIVDSFLKQEGKRFNKVHCLRIADNDAVKPTKQNILANLDFLKRAGPNDLAVLYVAAHGKTEAGVYYFLPSDTKFTGDGNFETSSVISINDLTRALDIPGRKVVMLDTCESGGVDNNRLIHNLRNRSTVIFTASKEDEFARESSLYGGYFTRSVTDGLNGGAAKNGVVLVNVLKEYVNDRVMEFSKNRQQPITLIPDGYQNFVIGVLDKN
jgi:uncharacterized caspase-like protein